MLTFLNDSQLSEQSTRKQQKLNTIIKKNNGNMIMNNLFTDIPVKKRIHHQPVP